MGIKYVIRLFRDGNVCVTGLRGRGKDMLIGNVVVRRKKPYISNVDYGGKYMTFKPMDFDCGGNNYRNFIDGNLKRYLYPYPDGVDVYVSDVGVYFPSQYCSELNKHYSQLPVFMALSRQLGDCNFHINVQNLNRAWDKIREQSDMYISCLSCRVIFGIVFQRIRVYDRYDSCVNRIEPYRPNLPLFASRELRQQSRLAKSAYTASHGSITTKRLIYRNKSKYDTRVFKKMLEEAEL